MLLFLINVTQGQSLRKLVQSQLLEVEITYTNDSGTGNASQID